MELEKWLLQHDIKKMVMNNLKKYLESYEQEENEYFKELFKGMDLKKIEHVFHSVSYVINSEMQTMDDEDLSYIHVQVKLEYCGVAFAEYGALYELNEEPLDDYFRLI